MKQGFQTDGFIYQIETPCSDTKHKLNASNLLYKNHVGNEHNTRNKTCSKLGTRPLTYVQVSSTQYWTDLTANYKNLKWLSIETLFGSYMTSATCSQS